jgi:hypothetical protein
VYGRLKKEDISFTIEAACANSGRQMKIALDNKLKITSVTNGSNPVICIPIVTLAKTTSPSIVDIF